jgi:hypothetical protein
MIDRQTEHPDYLRLIDVLWNLSQPLDMAGETILTSDEAAKIRACGIEARKGRWYCPALPRSVVGSIWKLCHLADDIDPYDRPVPWREKRAAIRSIAPIDPLGKLDRRVLRLLHSAPGKRLSRGSIKRTLWRSGPRSVDFTIERLLASDHITEYVGMLYTLSKARLRAQTEAQSRPRRLVPIQQFIEQAHEFV